MALCLPTDFRDGKWLTDACIGFAFEHFSEQSSDASLKKACGEGRLIFLHPAVVSIMNFESDMSDLKEAVEGAGLRSAELVLMPINNFFMTSGFATKFRGSHWSLLVFDRESRTFLHYDSSSGGNSAIAFNFADKIAPFMAVSSKSSASKKAPAIVADGSGTAVMEEEKMAASSYDGSADGRGVDGSRVLEYKKTNAKTPQQINGYDCGVYAIEISRKLAAHFAHGIGPIVAVKFAEKSAPEEGSECCWISPTDITSARVEWEKLCAMSVS